MGKSSENDRESELHGMLRPPVVSADEWKAAWEELHLKEKAHSRAHVIVYRAFMEHGVGQWPERGCIGCSMVADQVAHPAHLAARDTSPAFVSRGSQGDLQRVRARMGWEHIPWYTLTDNGVTDPDRDNV